MRLIRKVAREFTIANARLTAGLLGRFLRDNSAHDIFARAGYHLLRHHYYVPLPDAGDLPESHWSFRSEMPGVDIDLEASVTLYANELGTFVDEFRERLPLLDNDGSGRFFLFNYAFMAVDAHVYYALIRSRKPSQIVEVGSGFSTQVAIAAAERNREDSCPCTVVAIEPYPSRRLQALNGVAVVKQPVQQVGLELFASLEAGDIVFIDSTHALREGGDVWWLYCEVLPRLPSGVLVHVHDVSLPRTYPRVYFDRDLYLWNEQYVLQAFLAFNHRYRVLWPGNALMEARKEWMLEAFPELVEMRRRYPSSEPASFWMQVV